MDMKNFSSFSFRIFIGLAIFFIIFAWLPIIPCTFQGTNPNTGANVEAHIVCPINPFWVFNNSGEHYLYFGVLDRNNPLQLTIIYLGNILLASLLSSIFFVLIPKKLFSKNTPKSLSE